MPRFRKKPVVIEAYQFTQEILWEDRSRGDDLEIVWRSKAVTDMPSWLRTSILASQIRLASDAPWRLIIETLEGPMTASLGDWIIKGVIGEMYPCKPDVFDMTYEPAA